MSKSQELFTHAIVVFESLWPNLPSEAPKLVGDFSDRVKTQSAFKYSPTQNDYSGYYKIIPLNIVNLDVTQSKQGHSFNIVFDPSLVYIEANEGALPPDIHRFLLESTLNIPAEEAEKFNLLVGVLSSISEYDYLSTDNVRKYIVPGTIISQLLSELDTATIFLINEPTVLDETALLKIAGGNFTRKDEYSSNSISRILVDMGITPNMLSASGYTFGVYIDFVRKFYAQASLLLGIGLTTSPLATVFDSATTGININRDNVRKREVELIQKLMNSVKQINSNSNTSVPNKEDPSERVDVKFEQNFGNIIASNYMQKILANPNFGNTLIDYINKYYNSKRTSSYLMSWAMYESTRLQIANYIPGIQVKDVFKFGLEEINSPIEKAIISIGLDLIFRKEQPTQAALLRNIKERNMSDRNYATLNSMLNRIRENLPKGINLPSVEDYVRGISVIAEKIIQLLEMNEDFKRGEIADNAYRLGTNQNFKDTGVTRAIIDSNDITDVVGSNSSNTPALVLKAHVSSVTTNSSVNDNSANKTIRVSGEGFELPLKRHTIFFDQINRERNMFQTLMQYGLANVTPVDAALSVLENFAADTPLFTEIDRPDGQKSVLLSRGFDSYQAVKQLIVPTNLKGKKILQGSVVYPAANADENTALVFTPLHYINKTYLKTVKEIFTDIGLQNDFKNPGYRNVQEGTLYNTLTNILTENSNYSWFVDEFGYIKLRYEASAVSTPSSTILNPIITDETTINISTTTDEQSVYTLVEVVPTGIATQSPNEGYVQGIFGRAVPPTVADAEGIYTSKPLDARNKDTINLLLNSMQILDGLLKKYWAQFYNDNPSLKKDVPKTFYNPVEYKQIRSHYLGEKIQVTETKIVEKNVSNTLANANLEKPIAPPNIVAEDACADVITNATPAPPLTPVNTQSTTTTTNSQVQSQQPQPVKETVTETKEQLVSIFPKNSEKLANYFVPGKYSFSSPLNKGFISNNYKDLPLLEEDTKLWVINPLLKQKHMPNSTISLYDEMVLEFTKSLKQKYKKVSFSQDSIYQLIDLTSTLMVLGLSPKNINLLGQSNPHGELLRSLVNASVLKISGNLKKLAPSVVGNTDYTVRILPKQFSSQLPYDSLTLQNVLPSNISADLFKYGLRIQRLNDTYLSSLTYTRFRAEFYRRLHSEPVRTAQVQIIGNPLYKVGNTVLVVNERIDEYKQNYINRGALVTLEDLKTKSSANEAVRYTDLILKVDDLFSVEKIGVEISNPFIASNTKVTYDKIVQHFIDAYKFILEVSEGMPVSVAAYVPLFGIYSSPYPFVKDYLRDLVYLNIASTNYVKDYRALEEKLKNRILDILDTFSPQKNPTLDIPTILRLLEPQRHHAYQYHIEGINQSWSFGQIYTTTLNLNYGLPVSYVYIPYFSENEPVITVHDSVNTFEKKVFSKHIVGWMLNKTPHAVANYLGKIDETADKNRNGVIHSDHPLYTFSYRQYKHEAEFYMGSSRYKIATLLEKIKRKKKFPLLYGSFGSILNSIKTYSTKAL